MKIYVYNKFVGIKKFTIEVFLYNFPFNKEKTTGLIRYL